MKGRESLEQSNFKKPQFEWKKSEFPIEIPWDCLEFYLFANLFVGKLFLDKENSNKSSWPSARVSNSIYKYTLISKDRDQILHVFSR